MIFGSRDDKEIILERVLDKEPFRKYFYNKESTFSVDSSGDIDISRAEKNAMMVSATEVADENRGILDHDVGQFFISEEEYLKEFTYWGGELD